MPHRARSLSRCGPSNRCRRRATVTSVRHKAAQTTARLDGAPCEYDHLRTLASPRSIHWWRLRQSFTSSVPGIDPGMCPSSYPPHVALYLSHISVVHPRCPHEIVHRFVHLAVPPGIPRVHGRCGAGPVTQRSLYSASISASFPDAGVWCASVRRRLRCTTITSMLRQRPPPNPAPARGRLWKVCPLSSFPVKGVRSVDEAEMG